MKRSDTRLLTLTGAGGSGKTRLALRAAEARRQDYEGGPCFVGFADITDPDLIAPTICAALGVAEQPGLTPVQRLEQRLAGHRLLLVLDNLEQLAAGAALLGQLLAACPGLTLLVTSREPLHLSGERQYEVPVLDLDDAVELFTTRAQAIKPDAELEAELAAAICERLDRLPLAIELAASRIKALSPTELLSRLDRSLPLLTAGPRDAPQRQRTLRATIDWSYALLNDQQQRLFARMAVFAGGSTLAAAEAVCEAELDTLHALVDRSLIRSDGERYWMLQTLREYALERLEQTGEEEALRRAHAQWLIELLEAEELAPPGWPTERSRHHVFPERENFRAALEWASSTGNDRDPRAAGRAVGRSVDHRRATARSRAVDRANARTHRRVSGAVGSASSVSRSLARISPGRLRRGGRACESRPRALARGRRSRRDRPRDGLLGFTAHLVAETSPADAAPSSRQSSLRGSTP